MLTCTRMREQPSNPQITVRPPELHPGVSIGARLLSMVPYVGRMSDTAMAASTLVVQLLAINAALDWRLRQKLVASDEVCG